MNNAASGKLQVLWMAEETEPGVPVDLTAADCIIPTGDISVKQERAKNKDNQKRYTLGEVEEFSKFFKIGEWSFPAYIKASGALGTAPIGGQLLKGLMGTETINPSTDVRYKQRAITDKIKTYTILFLIGLETILVSGAIVNSGSFPVTPGEDDDAIIGGAFSGLFCQERRAGVDYLDGAISGTTTPVSSFTVKDARKFIGKAKIIVGSDDNGGLGYDIETIDYTTNTITLKTSQEIATDQADEAVVKGWTPAITESGYAMHGRFGILQVSRDGGSTYKNVLWANESSVEYNNNITHNNKIKNNSEYPDVNGYHKGTREVPFKLSETFVPDSSLYYYDAKTGSDLKVKLPFGSVAGKQGYWMINKLKIDTPDQSGEEERTAEINGKCFETDSYDDAVELVFD